MRSEFPALEQQINGNSLVYLDSAATTLKPQSVIDAVNHFSKFETANVHRGAHWLSDKATAKYEQARESVARFMNAENDEVVFTSGTTDGLNLLSHILECRLKEGDEILLTEMEHHSNLVPWHLLAARKSLKLRFIPVTDKGELDLSDIDSLITDKTRIASFVHISNALGTVNPIHTIIDKCKANDVLTIVDAAQSISCMPIDVKSLDCDFMVWSAHKFFAPYGVGVLYGKASLLNELPPFRGGGSMIQNVELECSTYLASPQRFEAGTPNIGGIIGLGAAVKALESWGFDSIAKLEDQLMLRALEAVTSVDGIKLVGEARERKNVVSFTAEWAHPSDIGQILDQQAVAVRSGHHCTQPLMKRFGITGTVRASFSVYSNVEDVERLRLALEKARKMLA